MALPFRTAKEAVALANNTRYGLAGSVWTENVSLALEVALLIKAGAIWVCDSNRHMITTQHLMPMVPQKYGMFMCEVSFPLLFSINQAASSCHD